MSSVARTPHPPLWTCLRAESVLHRLCGVFDDQEQLGPPQDREHLPCGPALHPPEPRLPAAGPFRGPNSREGLLRCALQRHGHAPRMRLFAQAHLHWNPGAHAAGPQGVGPMVPSALAQEPPQMDRALGGALPGTEGPLSHDAGYAGSGHPPTHLMPPRPYATTPPRPSAPLGFGGGHTNDPSHPSIIWFGMPLLRGAHPGAFAIVSG